MNVSRHVFFIQAAIDVVVLFLLFFGTLSVQYSNMGLDIPSFAEMFKSHYKALILLLFSWFFIAGSTLLYNLTRYNDFISIIRRLLFQIAFFAIIVFAVSGFKKDDLFTNRLSLFFLLILLVITLIFRVIVFYLARSYRNSGKNIRRILFIDENENTHAFIRILKKRKDLGYACYGKFLADVSTDEAKKIYSFDCRELEKFICEQKIQIIFLSLNGKLSLDIEDKIVNMAIKLHIAINFIPSKVYDNFNNMHMIYYDTFPILAFKDFPLDNTFNRIMKRCFDVVFSVLVIVFLLSWIVPIVALAIIWDSGRPVFYTQKRIGLNGKAFNCYKFRTMRPSKDNGIKATVKNDKRITKLGALLRKSSIDELPQFFNVLVGDMSVTGPRPHMEIQDNYYRDLIRKYSLRHHVKPGITGLAQIKGLRGEINTNADMLKRVTADIYYVKNWSFLLDIFIIGSTCYKVLVGDEKAF